MDLQIAGRTAMVTGAGGGLGSATCAALARAGVHVVGLDLDDAALTATGAAVMEHGVEFRPYAVDLADRRRLDEVLGDEAQGVDILVAFTGGPPPGPVLDVDEARWVTHFGTMVLPVLSMAAAVIPGMRTRRWGRVITSTSSGVVSPIPGLGISNTLRAALVTWSKTTANEVGADGVTCNVVIPGRIATSRVEALDRAKAEREGMSIDAVRTQSTGTIPVGRYGRPEEFADVVAFLASQRASYVTGSSIRVDGGLIAGV